MVSRGGGSGRADGGKCWTLVDRNSVWKVLNKEACGSVGGLARRQMLVCTVGKDAGCKRRVLIVSGCHCRVLWLVEVQGTGRVITRLRCYLFGCVVQARHRRAA